MSTITDNTTAAYRRMLAGPLGDSATYTHLDGSADQTVNIQAEPWEDRLEDEGDTRFTNVETVFSLVIGTEAGDVTDVVIGDTITFAGFVWAVMNKPLQTAATGWARLKVQRSHRISTSSPGVNSAAPGVSPGGRFDVRGT